MSTAVKKNTAVGVMEEVTEGTYVAPSGTTKFVQTLVDGFELSPSKEQLARNIFTSSIGQTAPRTGQFQVTGTIPTEFRAFSTAGGAPEYDALLKSALGGKRIVATTTTTKSSGNTDVLLQLDNADKDKFNIGDIVMVKQSGAYHVSPISALSRTVDAANITLLVPHPSGDMTDSVVIEKSTTYIVADSGHPSLSISKYIEGLILEKAVGCKVKSLSIDNFTTGQLPSLKFGFEGLNFDRSETPIPFTPAYDSALPPIVLDGRAYMDGASLDVNEVTVSLENTLGFKTSINAENGRVSSRATERTISGTMNPYKEDDNIDNFTKYKENTAFSLFAYAKVPTSTTGQFGQVVAVYMPNCLITELGEADSDGLLQDSISFSANRGNSGTTPEIYIAFI